MYRELLNITFTNNNKITIYGSVTLENGAIMCATSKFHNKPWFSNVSVRMESEELFNYTSDKGGICYEQIIVYLFNIKYLYNITKFNNFFKNF